MITQKSSQKFENNEDYKKNIFYVYISILDFLADALGDNCEIVLHDLSNIDSSIIAIRNEHISGRKVGGPLGDLALKIVRTYSDKTHLANYEGKTSSGKTLKSSTYFLKDLKGEIFGMLCLNFDMTEIMAARNILSKMIGIVDKNNATDKKVIVENFSCSIDDLMFSLIQETVNKFGSSPDRMTIEEKKRFVGELDRKGVFLLKGSVAEVAKVLKTSEPTVYRYLQKNERVVTSNEKSDQM